MRQVDVPHPSVRSAWLIRATDNPFDPPTLTLLVVAKLVNGGVWEAADKWAERNGIQRTLIARDEAVT